jgi:uncharacterized RDD family membrane protein YckC
MPDRRPCPSCGYLNTARAETCASCGKRLDENSAPVHPGETLRDPDDLTLPPSPLLRAVLRGEPDAVIMPAGAPPPPPVTKTTVDQLSPSADQAALLRDLAERLHVRKVEPAVRYAGFFVRLAAFLIDSLVLGVFAVPLAAAGYCGLRAGMMVIGHPEPIEPDETLFTILAAGWLAMATVYFTVLHHSHGQTIGKSLLGLEVLTLDLRAVGIVRSLVRTLGYAVSSSFLGFGFLLIALTPRKRGWHDFLAGTCVVHLARDEASA